MPDTSKEVGLARRLGLTAATLTGLGVIIGSGIYVIIGAAAGKAGNAVWLSFLLAAIGASFTALSYARLGHLRPKNAPEYQFVNMAFGSRLAFLAGWLILLAQIVSSAAVALGFAGYLHSLLNIPVLFSAIGLIILCSLVVFIGIGQSALLAGVLTCVEIVGLLIIIGIGLPKFGQVNYWETPAGFSGVLSAASLVFFAYLGFEGMANLSEEMKNPEKNLPRAIILALVLSALAYVLVSISAVSVVGWNGLSQSNAPLALVAEQGLGSQAGLVLSIISLASTANTVLILLLAASRIMHALSSAKVLPIFLSKVNQRQRTPWVAIISVGLISMIFASLSSIQQIAEYTNFITLLAFIGVNASAIKLLQKGATTTSVSHIMLNRLLPSLGVLASIYLAVNTGWQAAIFGAIVILVGLLVFWINNWLAKRSSRSL
jgi:basic amino acid/polyamine antiporter, APA family